MRAEIGKESLLVRLSEYVHLHSVYIDKVKVKS